MTLDNCYDLLQSTTHEKMICSQKCSGQSANQVFEIDLFSFLYMTKTPSEMTVAQRYKLIKLFIYTAYIASTAHTASTTVLGKQL